MDRVQNHRIPKQRTVYRCSKLLGNKEDLLLEVRRQGSPNILCNGENDSLRFLEGLYFQTLHQGCIGYQLQWSKCFSLENSKKNEIVSALPGRDNCRVPKLPSSIQTGKHFVLRHTRNIEEQKCIHHY